MLESLPNASHRMFVRAQHYFFFPILLFARMSWCQQSVAHAYSLSKVCRCDSFAACASPSIGCNEQCNNTSFGISVDTMPACHQASDAGVVHDSQLDQKLTCTMSQRAAYLSGLLEGLFLEVSVVLYGWLTTGLFTLHVSTSSCPPCRVLSMAGTKWPA